MYIPSVVLRLIVIPVYTVYGVCLFGIFADLTEPEYYVITLKRPTTSLMISGVVWLCSNLGIGLISIHICLIAYSTRDKRNITVVILWLLQSITGILWLWSHEKWLFVSLFVFAIYITENMLRYVGIWQYTYTGYENRQIKQNQRQWYNYFDAIAFMTLLVLVQVYMEMYKPICNFSNDFWRNLYHLINRLFRSSYLIIHGYSNRAIMIGQNVNEGGTLTVGDVIFAGVNVGIPEQGTRDVIINNFITQGDVRRSYICGMSLLPSFGFVLLVIYLFSGSVETTTETFPRLSNLEQE